MGARRTIARSPIVKGISCSSPPGIYKSSTNSTSNSFPFPHQCIPPFLSSSHCLHCTFSTTRNHDLQFRIILLHSMRRFHKCPLCPKRFKHCSGFDFHLSHTHEFNPAVIHHFQS